MLTVGQHGLYPLTPLHSIPLPFTSLEDFLIPRHIVHGSYFFAFVYTGLCGYNAPIPHSSLHLIKSTLYKPQLKFYPLSEACA